MKKCSKIYQIAWSVIFFAFVFFFAADFAINTAQAKEPAQTNNDLRLTSSAGIVISAKTGKVLWQKNPNAQLPLASLTKIVAIKVFLDTKPNLKKIVAYKKADEQKTYQWASPGSVAKLHVRDGETMTIEDILNAALLGSANNSVESLVRVSGLTRQQFIARMNKYAKQVGAKNTRFVEPTGLSPQNVSSVKDYAIISRKALASPIITRITSARSYRFVTRNTKQPHLINNSNKLVSWTNLKITGSKTGYLEEAQYCLMTKAKSRKGEVIAVTFGTPGKTASFNETKKLIEYGFKKL
jgi:D-alanyl-D-alanine carboxypeptidase (penicillin-binding protein 5/6)